MKISLSFHRLHRRRPSFFSFGMSFRYFRHEPFIFSLRKKNKFCWFPKVERVKMTFGKLFINRTNKIQWNKKTSISTCFEVGHCHDSWDEYVSMSVLDLSVSTLEITTSITYVHLDDGDGDVFQWRCDATWTKTEEGEEKQIELNALI